MDEDWGKGKIAAGLAVAASVVTIVAWLGISNVEAIVPHSPSAATTNPASGALSTGPIVVPEDTTPAAATSPAALPDSTSPAAVVTTTTVAPAPAVTQVPFTAAALLANGFTDSKAIVFGLEGSGAKDCSEAAGGAVLQYLQAEGCDEMMTGVYLEQSCSECSPQDPVWISVEVFPLADSATAQAVGSYLWADYHWTSLAKWCTQSGAGAAPCSGSSGLMTMNYSVHGDYLTVAVAERTDLTDNSVIKPWLDAAVGEAIASCGPQNYSAS